MKFGIRKPNYKTRIKARTIGKLKRRAKKAVNPFYGKKGVGFIKNPEKSIKSAIYHRTTIGIPPIISTSKKRKPSHASKTNRVSNNKKRPASSPQNNADENVDAVPVLRILGIVSFWIGILGLFYSAGLGIVVIIIGCVIFGTTFRKSNEQKEIDSIAQQPELEKVSRSSGEHFADESRKILPETIVNRHYHLLSEQNRTYKSGDHGLTEKLCKEDIDLYPSFVDAYVKYEMNNGIPEKAVEIPSYPAFLTLSKVYEQQKRYDEAISVCEQAIEYKLHDGTKGDYSGRIKRIEKKQSLSR